MPPNALRKATTQVIHDQPRRMEEGLAYMAIGT